MLVVMEEVNDAERRGDAGGALRVMTENLLDCDGKVFWRSARIGRLLQLARLGPLLPRWATSRWILEQSLIQVDPAQRDAHRRALAIATELCGVGGSSSADGFAGRVSMAEHDWVYRQLMLYEYGGLERFLDVFATPDLVAGADQVSTWATARMRSLRLEERRPAVLHWTDLSTGDELAVPNLGAAVLEEPGEHALARVVPTEGGSMFEGVPLGVSEVTARSVADDPATWLGPLREVAGTEDYFGDLLHGNFLLTDLPSRLPMLAVREFLPAGNARDLSEGDFARAILALARRTVMGGRSSTAAVLDPWPCVAALLVEPELLPHVARQARPTDSAWLGELADRLPQPADGVCRMILADLADAA